MSHHNIYFNTSFINNHCNNIRMVDQYLLFYYLDRPITYRIVSSNRAFNPSEVSAEHSIYLCALSSYAAPWPSAVETGLNLLFLKYLIVAKSSRRSDFVPTRINGTPGACFSISGCHLVLTFSNDRGLVIEKHIRNMSVC